MRLVMEIDVTVDPVDVGLFGSQAVTLHPKDFANLIEEFEHVRDINAKSEFLPQICG
jgi:hypothetical protein